MLDSYYDTLGALLDACGDFYKVQIPLVTGGVGYEESMELHLGEGSEIHIFIYRTCGGRYELVSYVL